MTDSFQYIAWLQSYSKQIVQYGAGGHGIGVFLMDMFHVLSFRSALNSFCQIFLCLPKCSYQLFTTSVEFISFHLLGTGNLT